MAEESERHKKVNDLMRSALIQGKKATVTFGVEPAFLNSLEAVRVRTDTPDLAHVIRDAIKHYVELIEHLENHDTCHVVKISGKNKNTYKAQIR